MSFNSNKYKLVKNSTNNGVSKINSNISNLSSSISSSLPKFSSINASSFKLKNTNTNLINQTLQSSNKLDDLLRRCREIGSSNSTSPILNNPITSKSTSNSDSNLLNKSSQSNFKPLSIVNTNQSITNHNNINSSKLVNTSTKIVNQSVKRLDSNSINKFADKLKTTSPKKIIRPNILNSNSSISTFSLNTKNKYKLINNSSIKSNTEITSSKIIKHGKFKLINRVIEKKKVKPYISKYKSLFKIDKSKLTKTTSSFSVFKPPVLLDINILLGRKITNLSKNKYKFISKNLIIQRKMANKYETIFKIRKNVAKKNENDVISNKILNIKGIHFKLNKNGKKLNRITPLLINRSINKYKLVNHNNSKNQGSNHSLILARYSVIFNLFIYFIL